MILPLPVLKQVYLRDLPLADQFGIPLSDGILSMKVQATIAAFERRYSVKLSPTVVRVGTAALPGAPLALEGAGRAQVDGVPYDPRGWEGDRYVSLHLPVGPVWPAPAPRVFLNLPGGRPVQWTDSWVQLSAEARTIQLYPMGQSANLMAIPLNALGMMALAGGRAIPNAWQVEYAAGYTEADLKGDHADVGNALGMLAACAALIPGSLDNFAAKGVAGLSASVDGLSNSTQLAGGGQALRYAPLIQAYKEELAGWEKLYRARVGGVRVGFL